jgi:putative ABC transport system substrate-binding protein
MRRLDFIKVIAGSMAMGPLPVRAQQPLKQYRIGLIQPTRIPDSWMRAFKEGLREFGYEEGKNLIIEYRWADGNFDKLPAIAEELVRLNVDVIVSGNTPSLFAVRRITHTIPIVMAGPSDPVATGLVVSLARPEANVTGLSMMAVELSGKRLEILKDIIPKVSRIAILSNPRNPGVTLSLQEARSTSSQPHNR